MNKTELETLADIRIREAESLLNTGFFHGAYYLAGYAVECTLKACIAKNVKEFDFPDKKLANDSWVHDLNKLLTTAAGLKQELKDKENQDEDFRLYWVVVSKWSEEFRYDSNITEQDAHDLFDAITDNQSGVIQWLQSFL